MDGRRLANRYALALIVLAVGLASWPLLTGRFTFLMDFRIGPAWNPVAASAFGFREPAYGGNLPLYTLLTGVSAVVGVGVVQKVVLAGVLLLIPVAAYTTVPGSRPVRLYAAFVLLFNPFVYTRVVVGQWLVLWGLAFLPIVLYTLSNYLESGSLRDLALVVLAVTLLGFNAHLLYASGILLSVLVLAKALADRDRRLIGRGLAVAIVAIPVNAYWLLPAVAGESSSLASISSADVVAYAPRIDAVTGLFSIATMRGFWRGGYVYATDLLPALELLFVPILFLAVLGFVGSYRDTDRGYVVWALGVTGVVALPLAAGVSGPAAPVYRWAFENVPFFAGMRDSQKFVALLVFAYAYLGALGLGHLLETLRALDLANGRDSSRRLRSSAVLPTVPDRGQLLVGAVVVLAVLTPLIYTFPMATGYAGQVDSGDYPPEWYEVRDYLESTKGDGAVLFLPWHQYMDYGWLDATTKRLASPAGEFFRGPVIEGDNVEIRSTYSTSTNPVSDYVEFLFGLGPGNQPRDVDNLGELLAHVDVEYVLVTRESDWRRYDALLRNQSDLTLAVENAHFRVYRNDHDVDRAYAVDRVRFVEDWEAFVTRSRSEDTTAAVYTVDPSRAGEVRTLDGSSSDDINLTERHPARYDVRATAGQHVVFTQHHATHADTWRFDGRDSAYSHLGFEPVFRAASSEGTIRHGAFYGVYLPSYGLSLLALVALLGLAILDRRGQLEGLLAALRRSPAAGSEGREP